MRKAKIAAGKTLLYREPPHYITLGKELPAKALDEILTDHAEVFTELKEYYKQTSESDTTKISFMKIPILYIIYIVLPIIMKKLTESISG